MDEYMIRANEPDGWLKAWEVLKNGKHAAWFRYYDSAKAYVADAIDRQEARSHAQ